MKKPPYRIVECSPGRFAVQRPGWLWGWNYCYDLWDCRIEFTSAEEAEERVRKWMTFDAHVEKVIKEIQ